MHESSVARALLEQVREVARQHDARAVSEVTVALGPLSGVEPLLLESAFAQLATDELLRGARLIIQAVPLAIECNSCRQTAELSSFAFACPHCGSADTRITGGDAVILRNVTLEMAPAATQPG